MLELKLYFWPRYWGTPWYYAKTEANGMCLHDWVLGPFGIGFHWPTEPPEE